jgi:hypothetical protein
MIDDETNEAYKETDQQRRTSQECNSKWQATSITEAFVRR